MQAGFTAYSQAVKYHSLVLAGLQREIDELKQSNTNKDGAIGDLQEAKARMAADIEDMERRLNEMQHNNGIEYLNCC